MPCYDAYLLLIDAYYASIGDLDIRCLAFDRFDNHQLMTMSCLGGITIEVFYYFDKHHALL